MSRSYKKPYITDQQSGATKRIKRIAARAVRSLPEDQAPQSGKSYRKEFDPWNIRDWSFHSPTIKKAYRK